MSTNSKCSTCKTDVSFRCEVCKLQFCILCFDLPTVLEPSEIPEGVVIPYMSCKVCRIEAHEKRLSSLIQDSNQLSEKLVMLQQMIQAEVNTENMNGFIVGLIGEVSIDTIIKNKKIVNKLKEIISSQNVFIKDVLDANRKLNMQLRTTVPTSLPEQDNISQDNDDTAANQDTATQNFETNQNMDSWIDNFDMFF